MAAAANESQSSTCLSGSLTPSMKQKKTKTMCFFFSNEGRRISGRGGRRADVNKLKDALKLMKANEEEDETKRSQLSETESRGVISVLQM